jgi:hypothetical protein
MATSQAASLIEKALGHGDNATTAQDVTNPAQDPQKYADPSGEKMKALVWMGKNSVKLGPYGPANTFLDVRCLLLLTNSGGSETQDH